MAEYKKQHVIAENYLKGFSSIDYYKDNKANCPIWFYNMEDKTLKYKSPANVAWRPYYYSAIDTEGQYQHFLEKDLSQLESLVNLLSKKIDYNIHEIRKQNIITPLTNDDRLLLVHFIYWHMKKVPSVVDRIYEGVKDIYLELAQKYNNTFTDAEIKMKL